MGNPKVSVLCPVYNAEAYIAKCLESLIGQTHQEWQAICVNDASTDSSLTLLRDFSKRDHRIEVVDLPENVGLAKARNVALEKATGDFVCMLDADDWFSCDAFEKALAVFQRHQAADCVLFRLMLSYPDGHETEYSSEPFTCLPGKVACEKSLSWKIHGLYMIRASIHKRYPYDDTCRVYSDENTTRIHYAVSCEVRCCDGVYHYLQHESSATHGFSPRRYDLLRAKESLSCQLRAMDFSNRILAQVECMRWLDLIDVYMFWYVHRHQLPLEEQKICFEEMHRAWRVIDRSLLSPEVSRKIGHFPMPTWWLFLAQEWVYFTLRHLFGRNS